MTHYPVLIAGGGPVGIALAIELGWRGIPCLVVEQSDGTVEFPTTNLANTRTCEHLRRWGIADRMRFESGYPTDYPRNYVFVTRMDGYEIARFDHPVAALLEPRVRPRPAGEQAALDPLPTVGDVGLVQHGPQLVLGDAGSQCVAHPRHSDVAHVH